MLTSIRYLFFSLFLFGSLGVWSQSDSLKTAALLDSALYHPEKKANCLKVVARLESRNKRNFPVLADILALRTKFELKQGNLAEAKKIIIRSKQTFRKEPALLANFYSLEGSVYATERKLEKAIQSYQLALRTFDSLALKREAAYVKNNIANVFFNLNDFESAYSFAKSSYEVVYSLKDTIYYPQIAAILAISEVKTKRIESAKRHAQTAIYAGEKYRLPVAVILGKYAQGDVFSQQKKWNQAKLKYKEVVLLSEQLHLVQFESYGRIGLLTCYVALKMNNEAIEEGEKVLELNRALQFHSSDYTLCQQLSEAYHEVGNHQKAFEYLRKANTMYREYSSVENKKAIQELLTKYETEKKERALSQKELSLSRAVIWILTLLFILFFLVVLFFWWQKRNKHRMSTLRLNAEKRQLEAFVEGERRERERIAADIHDGIASTLTGLMFQAEQRDPSSEWSGFAKLLHDARDELRQISQNISPFNFKEEGWNHSFRRFVGVVESNTFKVYFTAKYDEQQLNNQRGMVVYRILQELIQNTLKHAGASECELLISESSNGLLIQYSDNGRGTTNEVLENGNGWQSLLLRVEAIDGIVYLDDSFDGFKIDISLPKL